MNMGSVAAGAAESLSSDLWAQLQIFWPVVAISIGVVGAALGVLGTLLAGWFESKRERRRWLRERRFEAYTRVFALIQGFSLNASKIERIALGRFPAGSVGGSLRRQKRQLRSIMSDKQIRALEAQDDERYASVADVLAPVFLVGPRNVTELAVRMQTAYETGDREVYGLAQRNFIDAAKRVLEVERRSWVTLVREKIRRPSRT